jgi:hypothetical protein
VIDDDFVNGFVFALIHAISLDETIR